MFVTLDVSIPPSLEHNTQGDYTTLTEASSIINKSQTEVKPTIIPVLHSDSTWHHIAFVPWHHRLCFLLTFTRTLDPYPHPKTLQPRKFGIYRMRGKANNIHWWAAESSLQESTVPLRTSNEKLPLHTPEPNPRLSTGSALVQQQGKAGMPQNKDSWYFTHTFFRDSNFGHFLMHPPVWVSAVVRSKSRASQLCPARLREEMSYLSISWNSPKRIMKHCQIFFYFFIFKRLSNFPFRKVLFMFCTFLSGNSL